jgi:MFS family permease
MLLSHKNFKVLTYLNFLNGFLPFTPILILYFVQITGSYTKAISIYSVAMITLALFELPTGIFSDRFGRKKTTIIAAILFVIGLVFYAIGINYYVLFVGAIIKGVAAALASGNDHALIYDSLAEKDETKNYGKTLGYLSAFFHGALAISAITGSLLASISFELVMWISLIPAVLVVILAFFLDEPKVHEQKMEEQINLRQALGLFFHNKKLRLLNMASVIRFALAEVAFDMRPIFFATLWPIWAIGISHVIHHVCATISYYWSERILVKIKAIRVLMLENITNRILNLFALLVPTPASPIIMALTSLSYGPSSVSMSDLLQKEFTHKQRAAMGSFNSFLGSILYGIAGLIFGYIADQYGIIISLVILQLILLVNTFIYLRLRKYVTE